MSSNSTDNSTSTTSISDVTHVLVNELQERLDVELNVKWGTECCKIDLNNGCYTTVDEWGIVINIGEGSPLYSHTEIESCIQAMIKLYNYNRIFTKSDEIIDNDRQRLQTAENEILVLNREVQFLLKHVKHIKLSLFLCLVCFVILLCSIMV